MEEAIVIRRISTYKTKDNQYPSGIGNFVLYFDQTRNGPLPSPARPPRCDRHVHSPGDAVVISGDELVDFRHDLDPPDEVDVVVHSLPVLPVSEVVVEPLGGDRGHAFSHENLTHGFVQDHLSGKNKTYLIADAWG